MRENDKAGRIPQKVEPMENKTVIQEKIRPKRTCKRAKKKKSRLRYAAGKGIEKISYKLSLIDDKTKVGNLRHVRHVIDRISGLGIGNLAASVTYYLMFALFPLLIFIAWFVSNAGGRFITPEMTANLKEFIPENLLSAIESVFSNIKLRSSGFAMTSLSLFALLWSSSGAFSVIAAAMDSIYKNERKAATVLLQRILSLLVSVVLAIGAIAALMSMAFGQSLMRLLGLLFGDIDGKAYLVTLINYLLSFLILALIFSALYHFLSRRKSMFRYSFLCGLISAFLWVVISYGFSAYVASSARYSLLYGSLSTVIIFMLWLYVCSLLLFVVALFHSEFISYSEKKRKMAEKNKFAKLRGNAKYPLYVKL